MKTDDLRRSIKIIGVILLVFTVTVATHEGEFWPFSIYPMFSQSGHPWTRAMILDVSDLDENQIWDTHALGDKIGPAVPVGRYGVDQIDFSNFITKTDNWTDSRRNALITMFGSEQIGTQQWMITKVRGELRGRDSVVVQIQPFLLMSRDDVIMNPLLDESEYFKTIED